MLDWILNTWFVQFILRPLLDVSILSFLIYQGYRILYQTRAIPLLRGTLFLGLLYLVALGLRLDTLSWILNFLGPGIIVGLAIVFQPELRKIFTQIGQGGWFSPRASAKSEDVEMVLTAALELSKLKRGALIAFARREGLKSILESGTALDSQLNSALIMTVFAYDTALHDGGLIVQNGRIAAAGCFFPLSENQHISKSFGTRHRAALGLAEDSDAVILVVSEESSALSLAYSGVLHYNLPIEEIRRRLKDLLNYKDLDQGTGDKGEDFEN